MLGLVSKPTTRISRNHQEPTAISQFLLLSSDPEGILSLQKMSKVCSMYHHIAQLTSCQVEITQRRKFILKLAKALLSFGAPSHRIESQLSAASDILDAQAGQYYLHSLLINTYNNFRIRPPPQHHHCFNPQR